MVKTKEYTKKEALKSGHKKFFCNIRGWDWSFSLKPTGATPTGILEQFPSKCTVISGKLVPTKTW
jgi:hypothetical protein